jgi:hypothetical protein
MEVGELYVLGRASQTKKSFIQWVETHYQSTKRYFQGDLSFENYFENHATALAELGFLSRSDEISITNYLISSVEKAQIRHSNNQLYHDVSLLNSRNIYACNKMRDDIIYYNNVLGYQPYEPQYAFMMNFRVDWEDVLHIKIMNDTDATSVRNNNLAGQAKMFHASVVERGILPFEALLSLVISYICYECRHTIKKKSMYPECNCWTKSASLVSLINLLQINSGIPFYFSTRTFPNGKKETSLKKSERYKYIPSVLPVMYYALLELCVREYAGAVEPPFEAHIINNWINNSTFFCYEIINKFKKQKKCAEIYRKNGSYIVPEFDNDFNLTGFHKDHGEGSDLSFKDFEMDHILKPFLKLDDQKAKYMAYTVAHLSPSLLVRGSIELIIGASAQGTNTKMGISQEVISSVDLGVGQMIPVYFRYNDIDMEGVRNTLREILRKHPPDLKTLESSFLETATTNSAGLSREEIRDQVRQYTAYTDTRDQELLPSLVGIRIFDVLNVILNDLKNLESFRNALDTESSAGLRYQVDRRIRMIQMLRSIFMCGPFIIKYALEPCILESEVAATGKTTNDIRDAFAVVSGSCTGRQINSKDVAGMDTGTHKGQTSFVTEVVLEYLREQRHKGYKFFLDTEMTMVNFLDEKGDIYSENISILEWIVMFENYASNRPRIYRGGFFSNQVMSSNIAFESGSYKTSTQHTVLLTAIFTYMVRLFTRKYAEYGLRITTKVLGDDMFQYLEGVGSMDVLNRINHEFNDQLTIILEKFGYTAEDVFEKGFGEFLKQAALFGTPMPYSNRLCVFTSERRDQGTVFDKIKNVYGVLDELGTRVPYPEYLSNVKMAIPYLMGVFKMNLKVTKFNREYDVTEKDLKSSGMIVFKYDDARYMYTGKLLWPNQVNLVAVLPQSAFGPRSSYMTFASPAYCRRIFQMIMKSEYQLMGGVYDGRGVKRYISKTPEFIKRYWNSILKSYGEGYIVRKWKDYPSMIPRLFADMVDTDKIDAYGLLDGYILMTGVSMSLPDIEIGPKFKRYQQFGNGLLDPAKSSKSFLATKTLLDSGVRVPSDVTYYNRVGSRLLSVARTATLMEMKRFSNSRVIQLAKYRSNVVPEFLSTISYGVYILTKVGEGRVKQVAYDVLKYGFGPCVPPESLQAQLILTLGLPSPRSSEIDTVKYGIQSSILIDGVSDSVLRALSVSYVKMGSRGVELMMDAIAMSPSLKRRVWQLIADLGIETLSMPYAINPRKCYYYGTSHTDKNSTNFVHSNIKSISRRLQWAVYISEVCMNPSVSTHLLRMDLGS